MKRLMLPLALALLGASATASASPQRNAVDDGSHTSTYAWVGGPAAETDLKSAAGACGARVGAAAVGSETPAYKQCMRGEGWKYRYTTQDGTYPDPRHPGSVCHDIVFLGIVGSSCSNF